MKQKQKTETRISENTMSKNNVSKKNTSLSLLAQAILVAGVGVIVLHCGGSTLPTPEARFAFICENGTQSAEITALTATTTSCESCDTGYMLSDGMGSNCVAATGIFAFVCENGTPTDGMTAPTTTTNSCGSCDSGYSLSGVECVLQDLLITQFQAGRGDTTEDPMSAFRRMDSGSYSTPTATGCRDATGGVQTTCRSYVIEISNRTGASVDLTNYALIASSNGDDWGAQTAMVGTVPIGGNTACAAQSSAQERIQIQFTSGGNTKESPLYDLSDAYCWRFGLTGTLATGASHVVSRVEFNGLNFMPDQLWVRFLYNGDDGVALARLVSSYTPAITSCPTDTQSVSFTPDGGSAETWCIIDKFGETITNNAAYSNPGVSWRVTSSSNNSSRGNTFLRKASVQAPTANWNVSRGCLSGCPTDLEEDTITNQSQWTELPGYQYTNVGTDTLAN